MPVRLIPGHGYIQETGSVTRLIPGIGYVQESVSGGSNHALTTDGITTGSPVLGSPSLTQSGEFSADGVVAGAPVLGSPALSQNHVLSQAGITTANPVLGNPVLSRFGLSGLTTTNITANGARHSLMVML